MTSLNLDILIDYVDKTIADLRVATISKDFYKMEILLIRLKAYTDVMKLLIPKDDIDVVFEDYDRHLAYMERFIEEHNMDWFQNNFDDLREIDWPRIRAVLANSLQERLPASRKVFIVHGRDSKPVTELKTMLSEFGLEPIILHEQPSASRTIAEKIEKYSGVGYAFVLLTPDDVGCLREKYLKVISEAVNTQWHDVLDFALMQNLAKIVQQRARQNVVLEFGYFMGQLGRDNVCCLYKGDIELPSDMQGIVYIPFEESVHECRTKVIKELREAGYRL